MKTYHLLSQVPFLKKYSYKFLFVAFLGIHIPLLGLICYVIFATEVSTTAFILITLGLTLGATALTLRVLNALLRPIIVGKTALNDYVAHETLPNLPKTYTDEIGEMLRNIQYTIACLDEVDKEKQEVAELISHDLRTPVAQTLQIINLLRENGDNEQEREANLNLLQEIASKQLKFLEGMLKALKTKQVEIGVKNFETLSVSKLIEEILDGHKKAINTHKLKVVNSIPETVTIHGHPVGMKQVFENLITNAIKFSDKKGEIIISEKTEGDTVVITVQDNGIGFNKQTEQNLFKKFVPGHLGTNGEPSTGLGLYLAKNIVEKHDGKISASSEEKGARFSVTMPIKTA